MAEALNWVSRITSVSLMMVLPIVVGRRLDERQGTSYWSICGLVLGVTIGLGQLLRVAREAGRRSTKHDRSSRDSVSIDGRRSSEKSSETEP